VRARRLLGFVLGLVARAWLASLRLTLLVDPSLTRPGAPPVVLAFWHGQQFVCIRWALLHPTAALVSLSPDGELLASAFAVLGVGVERGSSSRGGASGLKAMVRRLRRGFDAAFAVDGPRGPRGVVRSDRGSVGAALAAKLGHCRVVPMAAACASCWRARSWDVFELPWPFSRVSLVLGAPLDADLADPARLGAAIDAARAKAELALARGAPAPSPT
jgi:lysophospholipid acyltransferase (LPLAT)-like uncharacterized protein